MTRRFNLSVQTVWVSRSVGYVFFLGPSVLSMTKTTDAGMTWSNPVVILRRANLRKFAVWWEGWRPGSAGKQIAVGACSKRVAVGRILNTQDESWNPPLVQSPTIVATKSINDVRAMLGRDGRVSWHVIRTIPKPNKAKLSRKSHD